MDKEQIADLLKIRQYIYKYGIENLSIEQAEKEGIDAKSILLEYGSMANLVEKLLEYERVSFEQIFTEYDFDGLNAIDILLVVSQEVRNRFNHLSPVTTLGLKKYFPQIFNKHIEQRLEFIYEKMKINIYKGITQKVYKSDSSVEMIARFYVSKLNEVHDPEIYSVSDFSFSTVFSKFIKDFIYNVATKDGIEYYKQRKQLYGVLNFGRKIRKN